MKRVTLIILLFIAVQCLQAQNYQKELNSLNTYLKEFDDGYFGQFQVIDEYIILNFKEGNYSKFKMEDMAEPYISDYGQLHFNCKNDTFCVTTDWNEDGKETGLLFSGYGDLEYLIELLSNFQKAYLSNKN